MRRLTPLALLYLLAPALLAQDRKEEAKPVQEEVVKAVRAVLSERDEGRREKMLADLKARTDLDWPSVRKGFLDGPYYQKPLSTETGERHSKMHFDEVWSGDDGKPRGYSLWLPSRYDPKEAALPVLVYLHHDASTAHSGADIAGTALVKFRDTCEKNGILFLAPYTSSGAEWWTPPGKRLVDWALRRVKDRYSLDEDRIALSGSLDGGDSVWYLGQEMPGTWSCLMPMTGDPFDLTALVRPLYLGTLDRMDVLMGVAGTTRSARGDVGAADYLSTLKPLLDQRMRITAAVYTDAQSDFRYLEKIVDQMAAWTLAKKREPWAKEVDVETDAEAGLRSLWLEAKGYDAEGDAPHSFASTRLLWKPGGPAGEPDKRLGLNSEPRPKWDIGMVVTKSDLGAAEANVLTGDILLSVAGTEIRAGVDVKAIIADRAWDSDVPCVFGREVKASEVKRLQAIEAAYAKKVQELRAADPEKPLPRDVWRQVQDVEVEEEEAPEEKEDSGTTTIEVAGEDGGGGGGNAAASSEETVVFVYERWIKILRPENNAIVRADFGAMRDPAHRPDGVRDQSPDGVRVQSVTPGSLADRSGLKVGDIIVQAGSDEVKNASQLRAFFEGFKFEEEPPGERFVEITVKRRTGEGQWTEHTVRPQWDSPQPYRVDARWDKEEKTLHVLARNLRSFTVYFGDELVAPGEPFHLFINEVPYQDLVDPASTPEYPEVDVGSPKGLDHELREMRLKRARVEGWQPDVQWAIEEGLAARDRKLVCGAKRTFDLTTMKEGFAKARARGDARAAKRAGEIKEAFERHRARE